MEERWAYEEAFTDVRTKAEAVELMANCENPDVMVSTHDPDGRYNAVSETCKTLIGYTKKELIGQSSYDYFHPEDFQTILKSHAKVTIRPEIDRVDYRIRRPDGTYEPLTSLSRQIKDPSGLEFILVLTFRRT